MKSMYVVFGVVTLALIGLISWYFYARLVRAAGVQPRWYWLALIVFWVCAGPLAMIFRGIYGYNTATILAVWIGWTLTGLLYLVLSFLALRDVGLLLFGWMRSYQDNPLDADKRALFVRGSNAAIGVVTTVVAANGIRAARRTAAIVDVEVPVAGLPPSLSDLKIVQISDIHIGDTAGREYLSRIIDRVMGVSPDIVFITGDLIDGRVREIGDLLDPLDRLNAPLGVYYITGNHEYYFDAEAWVREVQTHGITTLVNEHVVIPYRGQRLVVGGIPDHDGGQFIASHRPDVGKTFEGAPEAAVRILLAHQPRSYPLAEGHAVDLQLSGHTHGGQIWPFGLLVPLQQYFSSGLHPVHDDRWIYISRGTGYWGPPIRVGAPSEITRIQLIPA